jgi:hypothetical protein
MQHAHVRLTIALLPASRRRRWPSGSLMAVSDSAMRSASSLRQARETRPPGPQHDHWTGNTCAQGTKTRRRPSAARGQGRNTRRCKPRPVADEAHWVTRGYPKPAAEPADSATGCSRLAPPTLPHSRARLCMSRARRVQGAGRSASGSGRLPATFRGVRMGSARSAVGLRALSAGHGRSSKRPCVPRLAWRPCSDQSPHSGIRFPPDRASAHRAQYCSVRFMALHEGGGSGRPFSRQPRQDVRPADLQDFVRQR